MGRSLTVLIYLNNVRVCTCIAFVPSKSTIAILRTHKCVVAEREECARGPRVIQRRFAERWRDCVHGYNTVRRFLMSSLAGFESRPHCLVLRHASFRLSCFLLSSSHHCLLPRCSLIIGAMCRHSAPGIKGFQKLCKRRAAELEAEGRADGVKSFCLVHFCLVH